MLAEKMHAKSYALVAGLEPVRENCSSLHLVLELGDLRSLESENVVNLTVQEQRNQSNRN